MIALDLSGPVPPYEQIREQIAAQVAAGAITAGTRLPTVRRLASDLNVAPGTVARAYRELEQAGAIQTRGRSGTYACPTRTTDEHELDEAFDKAASLAIARGLAPAAIHERLAAALIELGAPADPQNPRSSITAPAQSRDAQLDGLLGPVSETADLG